MGNGPGGLAGAEEAGAGVQVSGAGDPESGQRGGADAISRFSILSTHYFRNRKKNYKIESFKVHVIVQW